MLIEYFDIDGVVHHDFVPPGQTVSGHFYVHVLQKLRDAVRWKRRESGGESGFCITMTHRTRHRLFCSNSSPRKAFLSSPNHRTVRISLRVNLVFPYSENRPQGDAFCNHGGHQIDCDGRNPEDSKEPSAGASNSARIDGASVCARKGLTLKVIR